jgi:DNA-directed RNA polymerase subunit N
VQRVQGQRGRSLIGDGVMIPVRCYTCGRIVSDVWDVYKERIKQENPGQVLDDLGIKRYCCRRMLLTHAELIDEIAPYE